MSRQFLPVLTALLLTVPAPADDAAIERARVLRDQLLKTHDFASFAAAGNEKMREVFHARGARALFMQLTAQLGAYEEEIDATTVAVESMTAVTLTMRFERGTGGLRFVITPEGELAGLWLDKIETAVSYEPPAYVDIDAFREEELEVGGPDAPLGATLTLPKTRARHPAVVLVHGSGPHDRDETLGPNKVFRDLAWGLASNEVAVLRYEKRTKAYPTAKPNEEITLEYETIDDARAGVAALRQRSDIDPARIFVLGHSLGGLAAPYIAEREAELAGIVLMAGPGRRIHDLVRDQLKYLRRVQQAAMTPEDGKELDETLVKIEDLAAGRLPEGNVLGVPAIYWQRIGAYDAPEAAGKLSLPILILHGRRDYQVSMRDFAIWRERLGGRSNVTLRLYRDLNHLMIPGFGPSTPAEYQRAGHVSEEVVRDIAKWIGDPQSLEDSPGAARSDTETDNRQTPATDGTP